MFILLPKLSGFQICYLRCLVLFFICVFGKVREFMLQKSLEEYVYAFLETQILTPNVVRFVECKTASCLVSALKPLKQMAWHPAEGVLG
jgi:hypothetical protein